MLSFHAILDCVFLLGKGSKVIFVAEHKWQELISMKLLGVDELAWKTNSFDETS
jgi:hypothetical protein